MRDFYWEFFSLTGNVDAYLMYKEIAVQDSGDQQQEWEELDVDLDLGLPND